MKFGFRSSNKTLFINKTLFLALILAITPMVLYSGCKATGGGGSKSNTQATVDGPLSVVDSAIQVTDTLLNEIAGSGFSTQPSIQSTCTRAIAFPTEACAIDVTTQEAILEKTYSNCTIGSARLNGEIALRCQNTFDGAANCDCFSSAGGVVNTPPNGRQITWTGSLDLNSGSDQFSLSSETHQNYTNQTVGGGIRVQTINGSTSNLTLLGIRREVRTNNTVIYDASILSEINGLQVSLGYGPFARAISGAFTIADRNKQRTFSVQMDNLKRGSASCCHPTTGSFTITDNLGNRTVGQFNGVDFSNKGCGDITLTENNLTPKKYTLSSCY